LVLLMYGGLLFLTWVGLTRTPVGFVPEQDKGYLVVDVRLPDSASLERTVATVRRVDELIRQTPGVAHTLGIPGQSVVMSAVGSNYGSLFVILDEFEHRRDPSLQASQIAGRLRSRLFEEVLEAQVSVFGAPAIDGLGNAGGFKLLVEDTGNIGLQALQATADDLAATGRQQPEIAALFNSFRANTPQLFIEVDRAKCKTLGIPLSDVFNTLQVNLGGFYVNDFSEFGRSWQVNLQADARFRVNAEIFKRLRVRNAAGAMVPLATVVTVRESSGPVSISRYNTFPAAALNGVSPPGVSSGQVISAIERVADRQLPVGTAFEWTELTYLQLQEGNAAVFALVGAVVLVFFLLAAQFESWTMPAAILLVVPMCLLSALAGLWMARAEINIFVQVGLIVLVGLAAKNAIFIVQFAREEQLRGKSSHEATIAASKTRLRPIVMTSFAFVLGVVPLMLAHGAGAEMRRTLGVAVFAGMLGVTLFGVFLTPVFYHVISTLEGWWHPRHPLSSPSEPSSPSISPAPSAGE
jgi:multidrug efflux pump